METFEARRKTLRTFHPLPPHHKGNVILSKQDGLAGRPRCLLVCFPSTSVFGPPLFQKFGEQSRNLKHIMAKTDLWAPPLSWSPTSATCSSLQFSCRNPWCLPRTPLSPTTPHHPSHQQPSLPWKSVQNPAHLTWPLSLLCLCLPWGWAPTLDPLALCFTGSWGFLLNHKSDFAPGSLKTFHRPQVISR